MSSSTGLEHLFFKHHHHSRTGRVALTSHKHKLTVSACAAAAGEPGTAEPVLNLSEPPHRTEEQQQRREEDQHLERYRCDHCPSERRRKKNYCREVSSTGTL